MASKTLGSLPFSMVTETVCKNFMEDVRFSGCIIHLPLEIVLIHVNF